MKCFFQLGVRGRVKQETLVGMTLLSSSLLAGEFCPFSRSRKAFRTNWEEEEEEEQWQQLMTDDDSSTAAFSICPVCF